MQKNAKSLILALLIAVISLSITTVVFISLAKTVQATTNTIGEFDDDKQKSSSSPSSDSTSDKSSEDSSSGSSDNSGNSGSGSSDDEKQTDSSNEKQNQNLTSTLESNKPVIKNQLVNPTAYSYQTNPEKKTIDITKDPNQKINTIVTDSFGSGVSNIPIDVKVTDPIKKTSTFNGKTDTSGKNSITIPVSIVGTWNAEVTIKSSATVGGPFVDTISWNAVNNTAPTPKPATKVTFDSQLAYKTVTISNDPRQQITTTVKNSTTGTGIKDVAFTIKLTNADGISKTFSRITDVNGVDKFVTPVDKAGNWKALITIKDGSGKTVFTKDHSWNAVP